MAVGRGQHQSIVTQVIYGSDVHQRRKPRQHPCCTRARCQQPGRTPLFIPTLEIDARLDESLQPAFVVAADDTPEGIRTESG